MFLSKLGYSELVQRLFEKMTFSLVDPLLLSQLRGPSTLGTLAKSLTISLLKAMCGPASQAFPET